MGVGKNWRLFGSTDIPMPEPRSNAVWMKDPGDLGLSSRSSSNGLPLSLDGLGVHMPVKIKSTKGEVGRVRRMDGGGYITLGDAMRCVLCRSKGILTGHEHKARQGLPQPPMGVMPSLTALLECPKWVRSFRTLSVFCNPVILQDVGRVRSGSGVGARSKLHRGGGGGDSDASGFTLRVHVCQGRIVPKSSARNPIVE